MVKMNGCAAIDFRPSVSLFGRQGGGCRRFPFGKWRLLTWETKNSNARRYPLLITCQLRNALGKQCSCLYIRAILLGKCPKPLNDFREIGCAPAELNINLSSESESRFFWLTAFRQIRFCRISVDRHFAKVSAHILYPELRHPRLYQTEFTFIYEKFDLYRSFAISVIWHRYYLTRPMELSFILNKM